MRQSICCFFLFTGVAIVGCDESEDTAKKPSPATGTTQPSTEQKPAEQPSSGSKTHSGEVIELGTAKIGDATVRSSREKGELKPGGDAPIDVWIDGGLGTGVTVVRFWIGTQDAKGSIKAKADVEDGKWHTHAEVPNPLPPGSQLWVEIEAADGKKTLGSFDLKK